MADTQNTRRSRGRPRDWHDKTEQNTIKSLDRALYVFKHLSLGESKPLTELAEETEQSPATVYRILDHVTGAGVGGVRSRRSGVAHRSAGLCHWVTVSAPHQFGGTRAAHHAQIDGEPQAKPQTLGLKKKARFYS